MKRSTGLLPMAAGIVIVLLLGFHAFVRPQTPSTVSDKHDNSSEDAPSQASRRTADEMQDHVEPSQPMRWVLLGDSLTEKNFRAVTSYYDYVSQDLGCETVNYGVSGTGYMEAGQDQPFWQRVEQMDLTDADCLTIFGSFNDLGKGFELGTAEDETTDTIGGCMNVTIQRLVVANPDLRIGIVTPTRWRTGFGYLTDGSASFEAITREECDAYVALLKEVAGRHGLPVLDLYAEYGIDPDDEDVLLAYYTEDGLTDEGGAHPNSEGHHLMYPAWREFVRSLPS